jgi:ABC-type transport system substrate-binding protein
MKSMIILSIVCGLVVAPLGLAQTSTTTSESGATKPTTGTTTETTSTTVSGTVTTFTPGIAIFVRTGDGIDPIRYLLGKTVHYVNRAGKEIEPAMVKPGSKVQVVYDKSGDTLIVSKVVVDQD